MKKFLSVVLALTMIISMCATASAATVYGLIDTYFDVVEGEPILSYDLPITIKARRSGTSDAYQETDLSIVDSSLASGIGVDFTATLNMLDVQELANGGAFTAILSGDLDANAEFLRGKIATEITVVIDHPDVSITNTSAGDLVSDNGIFEEVSPRTIETNKATIKYKNADTLTVSELLANKDTYLLDLTFKLEDTAEYSTEGTHTLEVTMSATTTLTFDNGTTEDTSDDKEVLVTYAGNDTYTVIAQIPSSGGGSSSYNTIKFETNGGNELKNISVRRGTKAQLPVPVRDGYVFEGWYTDSAFTTAFDANTAINRNYTLYAKWVEDNGSAGNGHKTPESLNGEDHFAYVVGYPDGTVRPNDNITRAEVTSIFFRLLKDEVRDENLTSENIFNDVNDGDWYNTAISTMAKLGIVNGRTADEFVPNANITRAEFAAICARFDDSAFEIVDNFADVDGHWAEEEIHAAAAYGWIRGYEDGTFKPDQFITRAEAMTMINRVLNRAPETAEDLLADMNVWPDNSNASAWYYLPVQEATNSHDYDMKNNIYEKWTAIEGVTDWTKYE